MPPKQRQALTDRSNMSLAVEPATVNPARLKYDYSQIDEAHRERVQFATIAIQDYMSRASESIIQAGRELLEIKAVLPHGQFGEWIDTEFGLSIRMAQNMMNAAREYGANAKRVSHFSPAAIYLLAAPSTPEAARVEVEAQAKATGTAPTRKEVKRVINKHKPPEPKPARVVYAEVPAMPVQPSPPAAPPSAEPLPDYPTYYGWPDDAAEGWRYMDSKRADFDRAGYKLQYNHKAHREEQPCIRWVRLEDGQPVYGNAQGGPGALARVIADALKPPTTQPTTSESAELPDGYRVVHRPGFGWQWRREITGGATLMGNYHQEEAAAAAEARQEDADRQARKAARTVYVEPQPTTEPEPSERPREYTITLDAEAYAALRTAVRHGALAMRMRLEVKERIKAAIEKAQHED